MTTLKKRNVKARGETMSRIWEIIQQYCADGTPVPTGKELGKLVGVGRRSACNAVYKLQKQGKIRMRNRNYGTIEIVNKSRTKKATNVDVRKAAPKKEVDKNVSFFLEHVLARSNSPLSASVVLLQEKRAELFQKRESIEKAISAIESSIATLVEADQE
jgi:DNA-binding transcriptional regulator YhcF (GntR family)